MEISKIAAKKRIEKLKKVINHHRYLYHVLDREEISDDALDSLKHELQKLETQFPDLVTPDSPTQRVGGKPLQKFEKVTHRVPMLSIEDSFTEEEVQAWKEYLLRLMRQKKFEYFCEVKVDGLALSLKYRNGILYQAVTRGSGTIGENVTENAKTIDSIPLRLELFASPHNAPFKKYLEALLARQELEVRGEVYITKKDFEKLNRSRTAKGSEPFANPRNLAAGSVRQLDPKLIASRHLSFLAYDIVHNGVTQKHSQEHEALPFLGFRTDTTSRICTTIDCVLSYWQEIQKKREHIPYQIDGVVVTVNDNATFERLGVAGKGSRGIRALKFAPKQATTIVRDIKLHVGRTGAVTPVSVLEPVGVGGVTVSHATLHNFDEIKRLDVRVGDTVILERAGDVIPKVVEVVKGLRKRGAQKFRPPAKCPQCHTTLRRKAGEAIWRCINMKCESRKQRSIHYFVSKAGFDIEGMGPKVVNQLMDAGLVADPIDIFMLTEGDLVQLERFGEKSAQNLIVAIQKSKVIPMSRFLTALNIRHVGAETAIDLAQNFGSIKALEATSLEKFQRLEGIGDVVGRGVHDWFQDKKNRAFIQKLIDAGVKVVPLKRTGTRFKGKTFVLTGTLTAMTREEAEARIRALGGDPASSVSKSTDYVVIGQNPGSKYERAKALGVTILSEKAFLKMLK